MSSLEVHSAGGRLAAVDGLDEDSVFFSLRFGEEHRVAPMAEQLLAALVDRGARCKMVNMTAGGDIDTEVFRGIERCGTFLVFGSAKYGEDTGNTACTYYEYKYAKDRAKRIILIRMIPFDQDFSELQARVIFGANKFVLPWMLGAPMPADLPDQVIAAMRQPPMDNAEPEPELQLEPEPEPQPQRSLGMPPSHAAPMPTGGVVAGLYERAGTVEALLAEVRLSGYADAFIREGYIFVQDLVDADEQDLEVLVTMLKKPERKRFERALEFSCGAAQTAGGGEEGGGAQQVSSEAELELEPEPEPEPEPQLKPEMVTKCWKKHNISWDEKFARIVQPPGTNKPGLYLYDSAEADLADYISTDSISGENLYGSLVEKGVEFFTLWGEFPKLWIRSAARADGGKEKDMQIIFPRNDEVQGTGSAAEPDGLTVRDAFVEACTNLAEGREWNQPASPQ